MRLNSTKTTLPVSVQEKGKYHLPPLRISLKNVTGPITWSFQDPEVHFIDRDS